MGFLKALETPISSATLAHDVCLFHGRIFNCVSAPRRRAPFSGSIYLNERIFEELFVLEELLFITNLLEQ